MRDQRGIGLVVFVILCGLIAGCVFQKKPTVVDPCAKAPQTCWYSENYKTPETNPACIALMKCYEWRMYVK